MFTRSQDRASQHQPPLSKKLAHRKQDNADSTITVVFMRSIEHSNGPGARFPFAYSITTPVFPQPGVPRIYGWAKINHTSERAGGATSHNVINLCLVVVNIERGKT
uniref:Uncharacterized protein n=1 Tax=Panagrellus redivivus TaxID=6233 RepID=A0A7E4ZT99_PANRE